MRTCRPARRGRQMSLLLEPLEARALLSAVIAVTGNGHAITSGDLTPSYTDFTDFGYMSTTNNALVGKVTRTFTITDTGNAPLHLTGSKLVRVTGANAGDFVVTQVPESTIAAGTANATTFVVTFTPHGTKLRTATLTIASDDPATPAFTFDVQGYGVTTTNFTTGLQIGTTVVGTGTSKAIPGTELTVNYTGFLMNGTIFDSSDTSINPGRTPFEFTLGVGGVIEGWDSGLIGMVQGETRVLIIPGAMAYPSGNGAIPANAPLIFVVSDVSLAQPAVGISGNSVDIPYNSSTLSDTNGTLIGTTPAGSNADLSFTFELSNNGAGSLFFPAEAIVLTGKDAGTFSTTQIGTSSGFYGFTVTYHPTKPGTQTATVHVITGDPAHPDFTFTVGGTYTPFYDFTASVGTTSYPMDTTIISGAAARYTFPVTVTNHGNVPVSSTPMLFDVYLHNTGTGEDEAVGSVSSTALRGLAAGRSRLVNLRLPFPITVPAGDYVVLVKVNQDHAFTETSYTNNAGSTSQMVTVVQGFYDLSATLGTSVFSQGMSVISGGPASYRLPLTVTNFGNLPLPTTLSALPIEIYAHNATSGADTLLTTISTSALRRLAVGASRALTLTVKLPITLVSGTYEFLLKVNPGEGALDESSAANNAPLGTQVFTVTQGYYNVTGNLSTSTFTATPPVDLAWSGRVTGRLTNGSNLAFPAGQKFTLQLVAIRESDDAQLAIGLPLMLSAGNLGAGKSISFSLSRSLLAGMATGGTYEMAVVITPVPVLDETSTDDNLLTLA